jgi:hypothetical protein
MDPTKISREDLYEQVWQMPMSKLAAHYGISDVALAKTCKRLNVPRPGRGYWARLAAGERLKRPPLPKAGRGHDTWVFLQRVEHPEVRAARPVPPTVKLAESLGDAHDGVRALALALKRGEVDSYNRITVGAPGREALAVSVNTHRRALLVVDALSKAIVERGHTVSVRTDDGPAKASLAFVVTGESVAVSVIEQLEPKDHILTPEEEKRAATGYRYGIPKYDHVAGGRLRIVLQQSTLKRGSWTDTEKHRLEDYLGHVVVAIEAEAASRQRRRVDDEHRRRDEEARRQELERERERRRVEEARIKHREGLAADLHRMAQDWTTAAALRAFLDALKSAVTPEERTETFDRWFEWATEHVKTLDPLSRASAIARPLDPE